MFRTIRQRMTWTISGYVIFAVLSTGALMYFTPQKSATIAAMALGHVIFIVALLRTRSKQRR